MCNIFNCKLNDLVHEDLTDIDSLDEDIKMSIVKLKKEKQNKVKGLSKAIYIIARIGKISAIFGIVCVAIAMAIIPFVTSNIKIHDNNAVEIFGEKIEYQNKDDNFIIEYDGEKLIISDKNEKLAFNTIIEKLENNSMTMAVIFIETAFVLLVATLVLLYFTMKHLEDLFINIHNGDTPFTMENVCHIKKMAMFMIAMIILPNISGIIVQTIVKQDLGIGFEMFDLIYILFLFSMSYIFEYGYEIQLDSKGKMYGEEEEE